MNWKNFFILVSLFFNLLAKSGHDIKIRENYAHNKSLKCYPKKRFILDLDNQPSKKTKLSVKTSAKLQKTNNEDVSIKDPKTPVKNTPLKSAISFDNPVNGKIIKQYRKLPLPEGIILSTEKTIVKTSLEGTVLYSGTHLTDYDTLIIIKHHSDYMTIYGFIAKSFVKAGQKVKKGQKIGVIKKHQLYFEIRQDKKPTNPTKYLHV